MPMLNSLTPSVYFMFSTTRLNSQKFYVLHSERVYVLFTCISNKQRVLACTELSDWSLNRTCRLRVWVANWRLSTINFLSNLDLKNSNTIEARQMRRFQTEDVQRWWWLSA